MRIRYKIDVYEGATAVRKWYGLYKWHFFYWKLIDFYDTKEACMERYTHLNSKLEGVPEYLP